MKNFLTEFMIGFWTPIYMLFIVIELLIKWGETAHMIAKVKVLGLDKVWESKDTR